MSITRTTTLLVFGLALGLGCKKAAPPTPSSSSESAGTVPEVTVAQVATFIKDKSATILDANDSGTREELGVVPGALLLSGKDYPLTQLPSEKTSKLVFYCGGVKCRASDGAAARAATAGYRDVSVMREGIRGWKSAGQPTSAPPQS